MRTAYTSTRARWLTVAVVLRVGCRSMADDKLAPAAPPRENLVAVRDRREQVIAILTEQFAKDVFEVDELDRRLDLVHRARSMAELEDLVADLGPLDVAAPTSTALAPRPVQEVAPHGWPAKKNFVAIFGGVVRKGRWTVPTRMRVVAVMGGIDLDFREADFAPGVTELHITCIMGGADIIVPPWLAIECDASAILGGFEELERGHGTPDPGRALLRITGLAIMGGVDIQTRMPGESRRQARRRVRKERKELATAAPAALPRAEVRKLPEGKP